MTQIPIYRAKKIDSDEYVEGYLFEVENYGRKYYIGKVCTYLEISDEATMVDMSTLAIHFNDMLDKNNNPIFASLSKDGNGGDEFVINDINCVLTIKEAKIFMKNYGDMNIVGLSNREVTGIYKVVE